MGEVSTRIWLDERLWDHLRTRALAEGVTVRELLPRLVRQAVAGPVSPTQPAPPAVRSPAEAGLPTVVLAEMYRCDVCGAEVRPGGLSNHLGRHLKERQAGAAERS